MSQHNDSSDSRSVSRRKMVKAMGAGSIPVTGLATAPKTVLGKSGTKKNIVILARGDQADKSVSVSKRWYDHTQHVATVKDALYKQLKSRSDVHSVGVRSGERKIGGLRSEVVNVKLDPKGTTEGIPDEANDVPVEIERTTGSRETSDCYTAEQDPIHGGLSAYGVLDTNQDPTTVEEATLTCRAYLNGNKYMMGCRHMFLSKNCDDEDSDDGDIVYDTWGRGSNTVGYVEHAYQKFDMTLLNRSSTYKSFDDSIAGESDGGVAGRVTGDGLSYLNSNNTTVHKRGRNSCSKYGYIKEIGGKRNCTWPSKDEVGLVESTPTQKERDSGGPVYYKEIRDSNPDLFYIVNIATRSLDGSNNALGSSADRMNSDAGITFGGNPYSGN